MDNRTAEVVREQQVYYRKRAGQYDTTSAHPDFQHGQRFLAGLPIHGDVLELDVKGQQKPFRVRADVAQRVKPSEKLKQELEQICGAGTVELR